MIDISKEKLISLNEVPDRLPKRRNKKVHTSTVFRWVQVGCRGKRLETCRIGGIRYTSIEALNRFLNEGNCTDSSTRCAEIEAAERCLKAAGF